MITQFIEVLPEGKSTPDFLRKPIALTIQEGKLAIFKANVCGDPKPEVTWGRAKGDMSDRERFQKKYDEATGEYTLEIHRVSGEEADTYKCYAINEYGKAICTAALNVIEVGFKKKRAMEQLEDIGSVDPAEFRKLLRKRKGVDKQEAVKEPGEIDERFWEIIMSADRKDYERICAEFGVKDFRVMLKKLSEKKKERQEEQAKYIETINNLKHIDIKGVGIASFEFDLELKDPASRIFLYKDGVMIPYSDEEEMKHSLKTVGKKLIFSVRDLKAEDAGLYQVDVEEVNLFSTDFKIPTVDFIVKIQEVKAKEREDAMFECVLSHPWPRIKWMGKNATLEEGEKYTITVSEDKLIHRLLIKDCSQLDKGIYSAAAGIKTCSAWLLVEADSDPASHGKKKTRKTTQAGGTGLDLGKLAQEQQEKLAKERQEQIDAANKARAEEERLAREALLAPPPDTGDGHSGEGGDSGEGKDTGDEKNKSISGSNKSKDVGKSVGESIGKSVGKSVGEMKDSEKEGDDKKNKKSTDDSDKVCTIKDAEKERDDKNKKSTDDSDKGKGTSNDDIDPNANGEGDGDSKGRKGHTGPLIPDTVIGKKHTETPWLLLEDPNAKMGTGETYFTDESAKCSERARQGLLLKDSVIDPNAKSGTGETEEYIDAAGKRSVRTTQGPLLKDTVIDPNGQSGTGETEEYTDASGKRSERTRQGPLLKDTVIDPNAQSGTGETEEYTDVSGKRSVRTRQGPLLKDTVIDPGVQFVSGLSNVHALIGQPAELMCKLSSDNCEGAWYRDSKKLTADDGHIMSRDGASHKLVINRCQEEDSGKYRFEADGRKTEAILNVEDPPRFDPDDLSAFSQPVIVKVGNSTTFKLPFVGREPMKIQWYRKGEELLDDNTTKIEKSFTQSRLLLSKCQRKDTGEIKIKLKNEHGTMEAISRLIVLDKPTPPQGPVEVLESTASCIHIKWRAPKDDGGCPVINYNLERQQVGRNTWKKLGDIPGVPEYKDNDVEHGRKYCYRIRVVTEEGVSDMMETDDLTAGTLAFPSSPVPPKVASAFNNCINLTWSTPTDTGGSHILGYNLEKRKKGSNLWSPVNPTDEPIQEKKRAVTDVVAGNEYEFRVYAINVSGLSEPSSPSEFIFAKDPKNPPGKVEDLKVADTSYTALSLSWNKPTEEVGVQDEAKGYFIEVRQAECIDWTRCNVTPIILTTFTVKSLKAMAMYWVRVIAINDGGEGVPQDLDNYILAMPPPVRPCFTDNKMKSFMVVRAGNSVRILLNFEASPWPEVTWLKDDVPLLKRVNISNSESSSQLLITSSERSDSGIYTIVVKNLVGQESFSVEVRVTDDPKPPGPVELEENVPSTVTVIWEPSPDEKRDDHLHYSVSKRDSTKGSWSTVADRLFNNKFTACNIMPGREYHFRVYAKNDMGMSAPSESPTWGSERRKDKFVVNMPAYKTCDLRTAPAFLVPLRQHTAPKGYECYMSCAIKGNPKPRVTWYRNNISLNTNTNYLITNICGVCSLLILRVTPKDWGEYNIQIESALGRAESSTKLTVRGENSTDLL
ncbi:immunoglobulin-like and fibronectin type III domain-containing protein 1 [Salmo trutta]|uniref:immunoglobulin-like and fibronectin type III domain-containing protein 1 n=1 Tax=Salmo trutta TaxID=8032 RepID=UPI001131105E|nr:immunoglobulin-like and fibronectin type III domain-containing protein 1 [Salmo trutta]